MFKISGINSNSNYKVNPIFQRRADFLKKASKEYANLEKKMQGDDVNPSLVDKYKKAEKVLENAKKDLKNISPIITGGNLDKNKAIAETNEIKRSIDYYW